MNDCEIKRLFIGIPLDAVCQQQIDAGLLDIQNTHKNIRWIPSQNRHLTLAFIGETKPEKLIELQKHFAAAYEESAPFAFLLHELRRFPNDNGRILAAVNAPSLPLLGLFEQTQALLRQCQIPVNTKPFLPHISLGKIRKDTIHNDDIQKILDINLKVDRVNLYESTADGEGRLYTVLNERRLF